MSQKTGGEISPDKMLKQAQKTKGYLLKKSNSMFSTWKQQYFLILNGALTYYVDEALEKAKGEIKIKDIEAIVMKDADMFLLQTSSKQYWFRCGSQRDRDLWVASLNLLKEYVSDGDFPKKILVKKAEMDRKADQSELCRQEHVREVLLLMKLNLLATQLPESRISNRIYCQKVGEGYLVAVSIKCLDNAELDEEILAEKYIAPLNYNKLYRVHEDGRVEDLAKMSQMQSLKSHEGAVVITFADKKRVLAPYKDEAQAYEISRKLCRCYEVAKEYYNSFKIVLKKNIDRLVHLYDKFRQLFNEQTRYRAGQHLRRYRNSPGNPVQVFLCEFKLVKKDLIETEEACKVMSPSREDIKCAYFRLVHEEVRQALSKTWENLFASFDQKNLILLSNQLYEYWIIANQVVSDSTLLEGCCDLNRFFMGRAGEQIKQKIHSFNAQKVQYVKIKSQPIGNELTSVFFQWMKQLNCYLNETVPIQTIFDQYCKFYTKCIDQFLQFLTDVSEKWNEIAVIIGACNDLSRIRSYFKCNVGSELCKGIFAQKKFFTICGNTILKKINEALSALIRKAFVICFKNIDKKLLTRPFTETDFAKICFEVLQRLQPYKNKLLDDVEYQMYILSFDEICFFFYTILTSKFVVSPNTTTNNGSKSIRDCYIHAIEKSLTEIEQFYCNIKTETYVKNYLKQIGALKQFLICSQASLTNVVKDLHRTLGTSFSKQNIEILLKIRQVGEQNFVRLLELCAKGLSKSASSQDSESCQEMQMRSRKSTLTQSIYTISASDVSSQGHFSKVGKEGYLEMRKVIKGISNFFNKSYFRVKDGHLLEYYSPNSTEILFSLDLDSIQYCYLDSQNEKCTFIIIMGSTTYHFKAGTRDDAGLWVQAIYSEIKHPLFQNKNQYSEKEKKNALFKNLEMELTTTSSNKRKTENVQEEKNVELKRTRRIKGVQESRMQDKSPKKTEVTPTKRNDHKKIQPPKKRSQEDEGSCCTGSMF